jgi:hypothetical protein
MSKTILGKALLKMDQHRGGGVVCRNPGLVQDSVSVAFLKMNVQVAGAGPSNEPMSCGRGGFQRWP